MKVEPWKMTSFQLRVLRKLQPAVAAVPPAAASGRRTPCPLHNCWNFQGIVHPVTAGTGAAMSDRVFGRCQVMQIFFDGLYLIAES
jgi:hypothetical protein